MIRKAFVMSVNAGQEKEYERRHRPIWPELEKVLKAHGVHNYSIFLHPQTRQLFAYADGAWTQTSNLANEKIRGFTKKTTSGVYVG